MMNISGITWKGESIEDIELLPELPSDLLHLLSETNGFILHHGALHVRGACLTPEWHSLRTAWRGPQAFFTLYECVAATDIPFAQDLLGDQFLLREGAVLRLFTETGEIEPMAANLQEFFARTGENIEEFLNVGLGHRLEPGQVLHAYPPFCLESSKKERLLRAIPASEVILFHAELAKQIRDIPDGGQVEIRLVD